MTTTTTNPTTIVCVFDSTAEAQKAIQDLVKAGVPKEEISLLSNDSKGEYASLLKDPDATKKTTGSVGANVAGGAAIGGLGGLLLGLGALAVPGIGPVLAAGPIAAALGGAAVGAAGGGIVGVLKDSGVPDEDASFYTEHVRRGGTLVSIRTDRSMEDKINDVLVRHNAVPVDDRMEEFRRSGWSPTPSRAERRERPDQGERTIPVIEEQMTIGKRDVHRGGVRVYSKIVETPVEEQITLRDETIRVERRPVNRAATEADFRQQDSIELTEVDEEAVIGKSARVVEEVSIGKESTQKTETVRDKVRRTNVEVEQMGTRSEDYEADFRKDFQTRFGSAKDVSYETYAPAYQYGAKTANDSRYKGKTYDEIESQLKTDYMRNNPNSTWDNVKGAVRFGWEKVSGKR